MCKIEAIVIVLWLNIRSNMVKKNDFKLHSWQHIHRKTDTARRQFVAGGQKQIRKKNETITEISHSNRGSTCSNLINYTKFCARLSSINDKLSWMARFMPLPRVSTPPRAIVSIDKLYAIAENLSGRQQQRSNHKISESDGDMMIHWRLVGTRDHIRQVFPNKPSSS